MGISKHELLNDYYLDEILEIMQAYNDLHQPVGKEKKLEEETAESFFGV